MLENSDYGFSGKIQKENELHLISKDQSDE